MPRQAPPQPVPWIASLLTILLPGIGHVHARRCGRGLVAYAGAVVLLCLGVFVTFRTWVGFWGTLMAEVVWILGAAVDARRCAVAARGERGPSWADWHVLLPAALAANLVLTAGCPRQVLRRGRYRLFEAESKCMEPTLFAGEGIMGDTWCYRSRLPERQEVIIFEAPEGPERVWAKRCVALPGDLVEIRGSTFYLNGVPRAQGFGQGPWYGPCRVPEGMVFCLGDNHGNSYDSRHWGPLGTQALVAKALYTCGGKTLGN
jgi:signal peptidase I